MEQFPKKIQEGIDALYTTNEYKAVYSNLKAQPDQDLVKYFEERFGIRTDVHRMCQVCQIQQIVKYRDARLEDFPPEKFHPKCSFVSQGLPGSFKEKIARIATEKDIPEATARKIMLATIDPVAWAEVMFGFDDADPDWRLRPYQKEQLRCLNAGQNIYMADGTMKAIEGIKVGDKVLSYNPKKRTYVSKKVIRTIASGIRDVYRVTSYNGDSIEVTKDHPFLAYIHGGKTNEMFGMPSKIRDYRSLEDGLGDHPDDRVYIATNTNRFGKISSPSLGKLLGYLVSDGYVNLLEGKKVIEFANIRKEYVEELANLVGELFPDVVIHRSFQPSHYGADGCLRQDTWKISVYGNGHSLAQLLISIGCSSKENRELSILNYAFSFNKESLVVFINRVWSGDGCIYSSRNPTITERENKEIGSWKTSLTLSSGNYEFLSRFRHLLRKIGVFRSYIYSQHKDTKSIGLNIQSIDQVLHFFSEVGPIFGKENQSLFAIKNLSSQNKMKGSFKSSGRFALKEIEYLGEKETYDIEVEDLHNFIAEGFIVHNCSSRRIVLREGRRSGKTLVMAIKLLYQLFTMKVVKGRDINGNKSERGPEIIVITPFQSQVTNIFDEMEKLLLRNTDLCAQIVSGSRGNLFTKTPNLHMRAANGGEISGFVTGIGSKQDGSGGGTIRGENANIIYLDEMDMIPDEVLLKVIQPILLTPSSAGVTLYATSTPIGKRSFFYNWAKIRPDFKEFYFPSTVLPNWAEVKREIESEATTESFAAEYLAEFIDASYGVFKPSLVHMARADYKYEETNEFQFWTRMKIHNRASLIKCIGIDWNKNAGSEFVVSAYDPNQAKFFVVEATNVGASDFSAEAWKEEVRRLNNKWKPDYIYADEGYGHTVIEDLRLEAFRLQGKKHRNDYDMETIKLLQRLKSFNFSSNVQLRDPITSQEITKPAKYFLVETAVRVFENHQILFPESDKVMVNQLLNYIVLRTSDQTGKPVYGPDSPKIADHRLDALMLSIVGVYLEKSVYAYNKMAMGNPEFFSKDKLENHGRDMNPNQAAHQFLQEVKEHEIPGHYSILSLMRGHGGSPQEHDRIMETYKAEEAIKQGQYKRETRRGDLGRRNRDPGTPPPSSYARDEEALWKAAQLEPLQVIPRKQVSHRRSIRGR